MSINSSLSDTELVEAHKQAQRQLARAKKLALSIPLVLLIVLVTYVCYRGWDFFHNKVPVAIKEVMRQAPEAVAPSLADATASLERVARAYAQQIGIVSKRDWPIYQKIISEQSKALVEYSYEMRARTLTDFQKLQMRMLANVEKHLAPNLSNAEREEFERAVAAALYRRLQQEIKAGWDTQMNQVTKLCNDCQKISLTTPKPESASPRYLAGMGLELLGLELERSAK